MKKFYTSVSLVLSLCILTSINATPLNSAPLPADLLYFHGHLRGFAVTLQWGVTADLELAEFELQRGTDNVSFESIVRVPAVHNGDPKERYDFTDQSPADGTNYYRIVFIMNNGEEILQDALVRINYQNLPPIFSYPNPASQKMTISVDGATKIIITSLAGIPVTALEPGQTEVDIRALPPGTYVIKAQFGEVWQSKIVTIQ